MIVLIEVGKKQDIGNFLHPCINMKLQGENFEEQFDLDEVPELLVDDNDDGHDVGQGAAVLLEVWPQEIFCRNVNKD